MYRWFNSLQVYYDLPTEMNAQVISSSSSLSLSLCVCYCTGLSELPVPHGLSLQPDLPAQTLSLSWQSDSSLFDIEIFHTELMTVVLNVSALTSLPLDVMSTVNLCLLFRVDACMWV